jgi:hypothetical protein
MQVTLLTSDGDLRRRQLAVRHPPLPAKSQVGPLMLLEPAGRMAPLKAP